LLTVFNACIDNRDGGVGACPEWTGEMKLAVWGSPDGALETEALGGHRADEYALALVHVGADVEPHARRDHTFVPVSWAKRPVRRFMPLNCACDAIRLTSSTSWLTST
jgi:hypothetical protein